MEGKIFGIPFILILLVLFIAALIDIPMFGMYKAQEARLQRMETVGQQTYAKTFVIVPTEAPTPTATPSPTLKLRVAPTAVPVAK